MNEYLGIVLLVSTIACLWVMPIIVLHKLHTIDNRIYDLQLAVQDIEIILDGPDDPNDGEDEPSVPSNVIAIGRRAA